VVDAAVSEHLEVLRLMALGGIRIVERVSRADAFDRPLLDAIDEQRLGQASWIQDRRRDADHVVELAADLASGPDSLGQCTIVPLRVPPKCEATCLVHG
jgi:hypothetical protein